MAKASPATTTAPKGMQETLDQIMSCGEPYAAEEVEHLKQIDAAIKQDQKEEWDYLMTNMITQMMFVSGETGEPSVETTTIIEEIVREQVVEMVSCEQSLLVQSLHLSYPYSETVNSLIISYTSPSHLDSNVHLQLLTSLSYTSDPN